MSCRERLRCPFRHCGQPGGQGAQNGHISRCQLGAQLSPRGFSAARPQCLLTGGFLQPMQGMLRSTNCRRAEAHSRERWLWFQKDLSNCMTHCKAIKGSGDLAARSHDIWGHFLGSRKPLVLRSPSCPSLAGGSSSWRSQTALPKCVASPALLDVAHCWPESPGKGGDLGLAAFEKAQGGRKISAHSLWESQPPP